MGADNITSEWKECRDAIARFDGYLFRLRLSVFTVFSILLSGLAGTTSLSLLNEIFSEGQVVLFIYAILSTYMLAIYILDRYYERMLLIAVYRASYLETFRLENFKIGLTTEIQFQKEQMFRETGHRPLLLRLGIKGSGMVNIIYVFLYILVALFSFVVLFQHGNFFGNNSAIYFVILVCFIVLGMFANRFLVEPQKLIQLRSEAVKSPIIVSKEEIIFLIEKLSIEISEAYKQEHITIVSVLNGSRPFTNDLMPRLSELGVRFDIHLIRVESTKDNAHSNKMEVIFGAHTDFTGKNVLILDDLIDTGGTAKNVKQLIMKSQPKSVKIGALINKYDDTQIKADFVGLNMGLLRKDFPMKNGVTDYWLFGYGMDLNGQFRDLDFIGWVEKYK